MNDIENNSEQLISDKVKEAVEDAQFLVAHAAKVGKEIDGRTLKTLVDAKYAIHEKEWSAELEKEFWRALRKITAEVKPVTADSIKAIYPSTEISFLTRFAGASRARRTVFRYRVWTLLFLIMLLAVQIYWVIGNQLTRNLADLLQQEKEFSLEIFNRLEEYYEIEIRFKQEISESESFQTNGIYDFYSSPEWERETLENITVRDRLENDLETLKKQLERNSSILLTWSRPWAYLISEDTGTSDEENVQADIRGIEEQIAEISQKLDDDPDASKRIQQTKDEIKALEQQVKDLEAAGDGDSDQILSLKSQIDKLISWVNQPGLADQLISQLKQDLRRLELQKEALERQLERDKNREKSRQAILAAEFILIILQSYLLPLLYGLLGAGTFILRSLSKEIESVTYSKQSEINYALRLSLGALAGIMAGWVAFILPSDGITFLGSVSTSAVAFLVGYNIEIFFSLMDKALERLTRKPEVETRQNSGST